MKWILALILALIVPAMATEFRTGNTVNIPAGEVINDDLVVSGSTINMNGRVNGDLVVAGSTVNVAGPVTGDLIIASGNVTVTQPVDGSMYVASGDANLNAPVGRNVVIAAGTLVTGQAATIGRDLTVNGGNVTVNSHVTRDLRGSVGTLTLAGGAVIGGDVIVRAGQHTIAPGATIQGQELITQAQRRGGGPFAVLGWFIWQLFLGFSLLIAGLIWVAIAPRLTEETVEALRTRPWVCLLAGLVIFLLALPLFILLLLTIVGIPIAFIWGSVYLIAAFISPIFPAILIARLMWRGARESLYLAVLLGVGLLVVAQLIPFFGGLVLFIAALFGLGALALALYDRSQRRRREAEVRPEAPPQAPPEAPPQAA